MADTLFDLVNRDPDTQVRLAAVEALYLFAGDPALRSRIVAAIARQDRAEVQTALVDLIVGLRERRAVEALRRLGQDGKLAPELRGRIASGLARLDASSM